MKESRSDYKLSIIGSAYFKKFHNIKKKFIDFENKAFIDILKSQTNDFYAWQYERHQSPRYNGEKFGAFINFLYNWTSQTRVACPSDMDMLNIRSLIIAFFRSNNLNFCKFFCSLQFKAYCFYEYQNNKNYLNHMDCAEYNSLCKELESFNLSIQQVLQQIKDHDGLSGDTSRGTPLSDFFANDLFPGGFSDQVPGVAKDMALLKEKVSCFYAERCIPLKPPLLSNQFSLFGAGVVSEASQTQGAVLFSQSSCPIDNASPMSVAQTFVFDSM